MIGEYVNAGRGRTVTISPAVPGVQYRITAWALDSGTRRSATPAVKNATTGEASENASLRPLLEMPNHMQLFTVLFTAKTMHNIYYSSWCIKPERSTLLCT